MVEFVSVTQRNQQARTVIQEPQVYPIHLFIELCRGIWSQKGKGKCVFLVETSTYVSMNLVGVSFLRLASNLKLEILVTDQEKLVNIPCLHSGSLVIKYLVYF